MFDASLGDIGYDPEDWYWQRSDGLLFSSRRMTAVLASDREFQAFLAHGGIPTTYPKGVDGRDSVAELQKVLDPYHLHASLEHYAAGVRWAVQNGGVMVSVGGETTRARTDADTVAGLQAVTLRLLRGTRKDGEILKVFADGKTRAATNEEAGNIIDAVSSHVQSAIDLEDEVVRDISARKITSKDDVDGIFSVLSK